jgi:gliding motility-associated-like protein
MKLSAITLFAVMILTVDLSYSQIIAIQDVKCNGDSTGSLLVVPDFGNPPYIFLWNTGATTPDVSGLAAGMYSVTVTDNIPVSQVYSYTLNDPPALTITLDSLTNVFCMGASTGDLFVTVNGGTPPYTYSWTKEGLLFASSQDITGISAGNYELTVYDNNLCQATSSYILAEPVVSINISILKTDVTCHGGNNGSIIAIGSGGAGSLSYEWSTGALTPDISGLTAGNYSITVTDQLSCFSTQQVIVSQPLYPIEITSVQTDIDCFGDATGSVEIVHISGANGPVTFNWSNGDTTDKIVNLTAGIYTVTITDNNLCTGIHNVTISQNPQINITSVITPSNCDGHNNGAISLTVNGGVPPYEFHWREVNFDSTYTTQSISNVRGGDYLLTITDTLGCVFTDTLTIPNLGFVPVNINPNTYVCNGLLGGVSINAPQADSLYYFNYSWSSTYNTGFFLTNDSVFTSGTSFLAGSYTITVTDIQTGCAHYYDFTINQSETPLTVAEVVNHNQCFENTNGSIQLYPTGGDPLPTYQVTWSGPNAFTSQSFSISGLAVGDYHYVVSDDMACVVHGTVRIEPVIPVQGHIVSQNVLCYGQNTGSAHAIFSGGTGNLSYSWSNGQASPEITALAAGLYTVTVTDSLSCSKTASVLIQEPDEIIISNDFIIDVSCFGYSDGSIGLTTTGGTGELEFDWLFNGMSFAQVTEDITNLQAGIYHLMVTDSAGCTAAAIFEITQPEETLFPDTVHTISCNNGADGFWGIEPIGIYHPYIAVFSTGDTISTDTVPSFFISGLTAGMYYCTITSSNGCEWTFSMFFEQPLPITVGLTDIQNVICKGDSTGSITLDAVYGGTAPYTYNWSNGMITNPILGIPAGIYTVTITDSKNCQIYETHEVFEPYEWIKYFPTVINTSCKQSEDGMVILYPGDIYWSPFVNTFFLYDSAGVLIDSVAPGQPITDLPAGHYITFVINEFGCYASDSLFVGLGPDDCILIPNLVTPNGDGYNDVFRVEGGCFYDTFFIQIFTDWGTKVFESNLCDFTWNPLDNKAAANTVYYYYIKVTEKNKIYEFKSSIDIKY